MKYIQCVIDNKHRELYSILPIKLYIERQCPSVRVIISNKVNMKVVHEQFSPELIVLPHGRGFMNEHIERFAKKSIVVIMPSVGTNVQIDALRRQYYETKPHLIAKIKRVYVWSETIRKKLLAFSDGYYHPDQLYATGNPRFDVLAYRKSSCTKRGEYIGVGTAMKHLTSALKLTIFDLVELYSQRYENENSNTYWRQGRHYADFIWYETSFIEALRSLVREIQKTKMGDIILRPHPFESISIYRHWIKRYSYGVTVDRSDTLWEFINKVFVYISVFSTSSIEALMMGIPAISMKRLLGDDLSSFIREDLYNLEIEDCLWQPQTIEEMIVMIQKAQKGELPIAPDESILNRVFQEIYSYDGEVRATKLIGDDLIAILQQVPQNKHTCISLAVLRRIAKECLLSVTRYRDIAYLLNPMSINDCKRILYGLEHIKPMVNKL